MFQLARIFPFSLREHFLYLGRHALINSAMLSLVNRFSQEIVATFLGSFPPFGDTFDEEHHTLDSRREVSYI
jgi:phosphotransferase system  glucose/maltose/N-acetylglucosamine-specific IIC component